MVCLACERFESIDPDRLAMHIQFMHPETNPYRDELVRRKSEKQVIVERVEARLAQYLI